MVAAVALVAAVACAPHARPDTPLPEPSPAAVTESSPPIRAESVMGGVMGRPARRPEEMAKGVPCESLQKHPLGLPASVEHQRVLLDGEQVEKADRLAFCEP